MSLRVVCHECRLSMTVRNCTRDGGGPSEVGNQVLISSHRKPPLSKAMVVSVAEAPGGAALRRALVEGAGADEGWQLVSRIAGTPQGGVISPLLANLFLHYGASG